jgi:hypothetical protein
MGEPPLPQGLEALTAVVRVEGHAEELPELPIEVGHVTLRMRQGADSEVAPAGEPLPQEPPDDALAGAGLAGDERKAALADVALLDAPAEGPSLRRDLAAR